MAAAAIAAGCASTPEDAGPAAPAVDRVPIFTGPSSDQLERLDSATAARNAGDYDEALRIFQDILGENPTIVTAYLGVGDIYMIQQDYERAEPAFARAARLEPRNFDAQYGHGLALQMLGRFRDAVLAYQRALTIRPQDGRTNLNLATSFLHLRQPDRAVAFAELAVRNDPSNGAAHANLGATLEELGRDAEATDAYLAAIELMGNQPPLMVNLINVLARQKRYREAANTAQTLIRLAPSANAYERLGWCQFKLREYTESMISYEAAVEIDPMHWPGWNGIGVGALNEWLLSERSNEAARLRARDAFRRSLSLNPSQERVVELMLKYRF